ncbi:hypothetical protein [Fulvivirga lutimaris]|uniref:hypothetical protein n=1 Tax=Fulvivirga lutimaris TaxID=1819566 RepID=UPI0012BC70E1|nr:hypothetical protein [Fulvivirga lutimaris]MTI41764.1 hypothetical protein [Fulvivirga lutimaris]
MKGISLNVIRLNKKYRLKNFGDTYEFEVMEFLSSENFKLKDINTLEYYEFSELIAFGRGKDFEIREI